MRFPSPLLLLAFAALLPDPAEGGTAARVLTAGRLAAEVMDPNHPDRYNRGVRFTPVAAVLAVTLDGQSFLYAPKEHDPITEHGGLASEFDLCVPGGPGEDFPPGYAEAREGEGFLKIGVGVLKKERTPYTLFQNAALIAPALTTVRWLAGSAVFHQVCGGVNGYAYELEATVAVEGNEVTVDWKLTNTGSKRFTTRQYAHNFFRFGSFGAEGGYALSFPYDFRAEGIESGQRQEGRRILFTGKIPRWVNILVRPPADYAGPNALVVSDSRSGQSVRCETSLAGPFTAIHARRDYIAPEQFIVLSLAPGESKTWKRIYAFSNAPLPAASPASN